MRLKTNLPLSVWEELPALCRWAREALQAFEAKVPFARQRNFALSQSFLRVSGPNTKATLTAICVSLDFPHRDTAVFSILQRALPALEEWLKSLPINPAASAANLENLLYGRNWNSPAQNHSSSPLGASGSSGRATALYANAYHTALAQQNALTAGLAGAGGLNASQQIIQQQNILAKMSAMQQQALLYGGWDLSGTELFPAQKSFPKTERGEASLSEALSGALPEAEELEKATRKHRVMHNKYLALTGKSTSDTAWGTPPENSQLHIQQGEILATRIWFTDSMHLSSIHKNRWWEPGSTMDGDVTKAGVFAFKKDALAIPLLYCYIRDARHLRQEVQNAGLMIFPEFTHVRSARAIVMGTVKLWGDVVEHQYGYRAQFARIASLQECSEPSMLPAIRIHYGVSHD